MSLDSDKMMEEFVTESLEHLADVENDLLVIEEAGANSDGDLVNKVFRAVHSIKGASGFLGLTRIAELSHSLENVLNLVRSRELVPTAPVIDALLKAVDRLRGLLNNVSQSNEVDVSEHVAALKQVITGQASPEVCRSMERSVQVGRESSPFQVSEHTLQTQKRLGNQLFILEFDLIADVENRGRTPLSLINNLLSLGELIETRLDHSSWGGLDSLIPDKVHFVTLLGTVVDADMLATEFALPADRIRPVTTPVTGGPSVAGSPAPENPATSAAPASAPATLTPPAASQATSVASPQPATTASPDARRNPCSRGNGREARRNQHPRVRGPARSVDEPRR